MQSFLKFSGESFLSLIGLFLKSTDYKGSIIVKALAFFFFFFSSRFRHKQKAKIFVCFVNTQEQMKLNASYFVPVRNSTFRVVVTVSARAHANICRPKSHCNYDMKEIPEARYHRFLLNSWLARRICARGPKFDLRISFLVRLLSVLCS